MNTTRIRPQQIVLFDGVCNLCNRSIIFVLQHEREPVFKFASIQSEAGQALLARHKLPADYLRSVILIEGEIAYLASTAALQIGQTLKFPWNVLAHAGMIVPKFIRDWVYNQIALHRYQWFGKQDVCMVPTPELKARFL